jgi:cellulose synthase (UDP-forming)
MLSVSARTTGNDADGDTMELPAQRRVSSSRRRHEGAHRRWLREPLARHILQRTIYALVLIIGLVLAGRFALFWFNSTRMPRDFSSHFWLADLVLFSALTFVVWHRLFIDVATWVICSRIEPPHSVTEPPRGLRVAFITTFVPGSEPIDMLTRTLRSMIAADYPHDTWVLDEGNDP